MSDSSSYSEQEKEQQEYSVGQKYRISTVYQLLANALPTEGRDYSIGFAFPDGPDGNTMSVKFDAHTEIGKIWCDYCKKILRTTFRK